jgi:hypothetical protein
MDMARLNPAYGRRLSAVMLMLGRPKERTDMQSSRSASVADADSLSMLCREVRAIPDLFARARAQCARAVQPASGGGSADDCGEAADVTFVRDKQINLLDSLARQLQSCRDVQTECCTRILPRDRERIGDALSTLETEYLRLRDAAVLLGERRSRLTRSNESDDDPEFTGVLEHIVCNADQGDDVAASVAQAVRLVISVLAAYVGDT